MAVAYKQLARITMNHTGSTTEMNASSVVRICLMSVARSTDFAIRTRRWLSSEEEARAKRFLRDADRQRFMLGRAMIRRLCASHLDLEPGDVRLEESATGKPYLFCDAQDDWNRLEFNLSHAGDCVLVAWSIGQPIGVDVEALDHRMSPSFEEMTSTAYSDDERDVLSAAAGGQMAQTFFRIWVRKEAVLKAEGCGLGGLLQDFSVARQHASHTEWAELVRYPVGGRVWRIVDLDCAPGHIAAIAMPEGSNIVCCKPEEVGFH